MKINISPPGVVLFCEIPLRFIIEWMPLIGMPIVSTAMVGIEYYALLLCIVQVLNNNDYRKLSRLPRFLLWIYTIYSLYLIYDLIISPKMPRAEIQRVPESDMELFHGIIMLGIVMSLTAYYNLKVNFERWARISCAFLVVMLLIYMTRVDIRLYAVERAISEAQNAESNMADYGAFDSLRLGWFCGITFVLNLFLKNKWTNNTMYNSVLFWSITFLSLSISVATIQRGPVVFIITTSIFYAFAKGYLGLKNAKFVIPLIILLIVFTTAIYTYLYSMAPELMERFAGTLEGGASGRFGSKDSAYSMAFGEFMMNPIFGHYLRYTEARGYFYGLYPHNILLESLMTMGIVFSIPFFIVLWQCVKNSYYAIKDDAPVAVFGLIFIYIFSTLMTSASMVLMNTFWVPLAVISTYIPLEKTERISHDEEND